MRLEQRVSGEEFHQDTPNAPDVTGEAPAKIQDNLGGPVVPCGHDRRVVLIIESG